MCQFFHLILIIGLPLIVLEAQWCYSWTGLYQFALGSKLQTEYHVESRVFIFVFHATVCVQNFLNYALYIVFTRILVEFSRTL